MENLEKIIEEIKKKKFEILKEINEVIEKNNLPKDSHYDHITKNLMVYAINIGNIEPRPESINEALKEIRLYETYCRLLNNFPEFRAGEFTSKGYFPKIKDVGREGLRGPENYIILAEELLKKRLKK